MGCLVRYIVASALAWGPTAIVLGTEDTPSLAGERGRQHWAFQPIHKPELPNDQSNGSLHPIDRFIAAHYRAKGVEPVAPAERRKLLRRVTFDLIGLPPTPGEIAAFL